MDVSLKHVKLYAESLFWRTARRCGEMLSANRINISLNGFLAATLILNINCLLTLDATRFSTKQINNVTEPVQ
jgi:hypothetical protein